MKFSAMFAALAVTFACLPLVAEDAKKPDEVKKLSPAEELTKRIDEIISLLEAKEYEKFVEKCVPPDRLAKMKESGVTIKDAVKQMGDERPLLLVKILKQIKSVQPVLSNEGKTATFALKTDGLPADFPKEVDFEKIDGTWYMK